MLQALLGSAGLTPDDLEIVEYPDFSQGAAVSAGRRGRRDRLRQQRAGPAGADRGGRRRSCASTTSRRCPGPGLIAGTATSRRSTTRSAAFVAATLRAMDEITADPEVGLDAAIMAVPELGTARETQAAILDATIEVWTGPAQEAAGSARSTPADWDASIEYLTTLDLVPNPVTSDDVLDTVAPAGRRTDDRCSAAIRPSAARRSWWLREALAAEAAAAPHLAAAAPPLRGTTTADVVVIGGGYTGLWTAYRLTELAPGARVVARGGRHLRRRPVRAERRVRHGLVGRAADADRALRGGRVRSRSLGRSRTPSTRSASWCATNGVDAWYTKAGSPCRRQRGTRPGRRLGRGRRGVPGDGARATGTCR